MIRSCFIIRYLGVLSGSLRIKLRAEIILKISFSDFEFVDQVAGQCNLPAPENLASITQEDSMTHN